MNSDVLQSAIINFITLLPNYSFDLTFMAENGYIAGANGVSHGEAIDLIINQNNNVVVEFFYDGSHVGTATFQDEEWVNFSIYV